MLGTNHRIVGEHEFAIPPEASHGLPPEPQALAPTLKDGSAS